MKIQRGGFEIYDTRMRCCVDEEINRQVCHQSDYLWLFVIVRWRLAEECEVDRRAQTTMTELMLDMKIVCFFFSEVLFEN